LTAIPYKPLWPFFTPPICVGINGAPNAVRYLVIIRENLFINIKVALTVGS
jgi:hypothetical protein